MIRIGFWEVYYTTTVLRSPPNSVGNCSGSYARYLPMLYLGLGGIFLKPNGRKVETFRIDYLVRTPKVEKLSLRPVSTMTIRRNPGWLTGCSDLDEGSRVYCFWIL